MNIDRVMKYETDECVDRQVHLSQDTVTDSSGSDSVEVVNASVCNTSSVHVNSSSCTASLGSSSSSTDEGWLMFFLRTGFTSRFCQCQY